MSTPAWIEIHYRRQLPKNKQAFVLTESEKDQNEDGVWAKAEAITDVLDLADVFAERYKNSALYEHQMRMWRQQEHAYMRSLQGLTGVCENCGHMIPHERMQVAPYATRCITCQVFFEKGGK